MFIDHGGNSTDAARELKAIEEAESSPAPLPSSNPNNLSDAFEALHVEDGPAFFTTRNSSMLQKGAGAFAAREFRRGDLILSEKPIIFI
jgi:hypothetical protein